MLSKTLFTNRKHSTNFSTESIQYYLMFLSVHSLSMSLFCTFSCIVHPMNLQTLLATGMYLHNFICSSAISLSLYTSTSHFHALVLIVITLHAHFLLTFSTTRRNHWVLALMWDVFDLLENGLNIVIFILHVGHGAAHTDSYSQESGRDDQLVHFFELRVMNCKSDFSQRWMPVRVISL